jgi:dihydroorotate dehydrogenase
MYKTFIRPLLFCFPPERVHKLAVFSLRIISYVPGIKSLMRRYFLVTHPKLERNLFGIRFPNPIGIAAGFDKSASLYNQLACLGFGHIELGTVTPKAQPGNPLPRLFRLQADHALINRMGFNSQGVDVFIQNLRKDTPEVIIGGNIGKNTISSHDQVIADYCHCFEALFPYVDYFTINISCPNISNLSKLQDKEELDSLLKAITKKNTEKNKPKPVLLKIAPDLTPIQLDEVIEVALENGIDGIIATNTTTGRDKLKSDEQKIRQIGQGGLSGKPLREKSTQTIRYIHQKTGGRLPIIGVGGIFTTEDALEKLQAGASLIQIYTGFIYEGPSIARRINKSLIKLL